MKLTTGLSNLTEQQKVRKAPTVAPALDNDAESPQPTAAFLQQQAGNQALGHLGHSQTGDPAHARAVLQRLVAGPVQTKLTLGPVGDPYEQEADRVAKAVMSQVNAPALQPAALQRQDGLEEEELQMKPQVSTLQRQDLPEEDELMMKPAPERLQRQELPDEEDLMMKPTLQRSDLLDGGPVGDDIESAIQRTRGGGAGLPDGVRGSMESAFGADFSGVRVHTDRTAHDLNQSLQARAFTTGQDIFFRQGDYTPGNSAGQELLAHELTHVVQQNGPAVQREEQ